MAIDKVNLATVEKMWRREVEAAHTYKHARRARKRSQAARHPAAARRAGRQARRALVRAHRCRDRTRARSEGGRARAVLVPAHLRSERRAAPARAGGEQGRSRVRPADGAAERSGRSADRRGGDARGARSRRGPAHAGRRQRSRRRARRSTRSSAASAGTSAAPAGLATRSTASTTASAPCSASSPAWPATPAAARSCSPPASPARSPARCRWAPAPTWRRNPSARSTNRKSRASGPRSRRTRTRRLLELELFYQLKGFSAEEARAMAERMQKEPKQFLRTLVHEELGLSEETLPEPLALDDLGQRLDRDRRVHPDHPVLLHRRHAGGDRVVHHQHRSRTSSSARRRRWSRRGRGGRAAPR